MGLFLDRDFSSQKQTVASNAGIINVGYGAQAANANGNFFEALPSIFMMGFNLLSEINPEDDGKGGEDPKAKEKIDKNNEELKAIFSEAGVTDAKGLDDKVVNLTSNVEHLDNVVKDANTVLAQGKSADIKQNIENYCDFETGEPKKDDNGNPKQLPFDFQTEKAKYQKALDAEKIIAEKQPELDTKKAELTKLTALKGQAENLQNEIDHIKTAKDSDGNKYNVKKETNDIKVFMQKLKDFQAATSASEKQYAAAALKVAFEQGDSKKGKDGVQQASVQKAYQMIVKQYPEYFN